MTTSLKQKVLEIATLCAVCAWLLHLGTATAMAQGGAGGGGAGAGGASSGGASGSSASGGTGGSSAGSGLGSNSSPGQTAAPSNSSSRTTDTSRDLDADAARLTPRDTAGSESKRLNKQDYSTNRNIQNDTWRNTQGARGDRQGDDRRSPRDTESDLRSDGNRGLSKDEDAINGGERLDRRGTDRDDRRDGRDAESLDERARARLRGTSNDSDRDARDGNGMDGQSRRADRQDGGAEFQRGGGGNGTRGGRDSSDERYDRTSRNLRLAASRAARFDPNNLSVADLGLIVAPKRGYILVTDIRDGVLANVGFQPGDYLLSVNGQKVRDQAAFVRALLSSKNMEAPVGVYRNGRHDLIFVKPREVVLQYSTGQIDTTRLR